MRLCTTNLTFKEVQPKLKELVDTLFKIVPAGVGAKGFVQVNKTQFKDVMEQGIKWCVENDYGWKEDLERTEGYGKIDWADSSKVSDKAISRGINQMDKGVFDQVTNVACLPGIVKYAYCMPDGHISVS